jgi:hypothetical protein
MIPLKPAEGMDKGLAHWINERYKIFLKREAGDEKPWTDDPVLRKVRFTNVHRENDRVTRWIKDNWRQPYHDHPNIVLGMVLARMVNRPETLQIIRFPTVWGDAQRDHYKKILRALTNDPTHGPVWGNAYLISTCGKRMLKEDYVIDSVCERVSKLQSPPQNFMHLWHDWLTCVDGLGSFLAAQVLADLKNIPSHPLHTAPDRSGWCAWGPGSLKGLSAFYGRPSTPRTFYEDIAACYAVTRPYIQNYVPFIDMQDFQNCLCEFSKYVRVWDGGRAKNSYPG